MVKTYDVFLFILDLPLGMEMYVCYECFIKDV